MASLTGQAIASSYEQILALPNGGGDTTTLVALTDGDGVNTFCLQLATTQAAFESSVSAHPIVSIKNTTDDQVGAELRFIATQGGTDGVDNDIAGTVSFYSNDDGTPTNQKFAHMVATAIDVSSGAEKGKLELGVAEYDGTVTTGLTLSGTSTNGEVDVTVGAGAASAVAVPGVLNVTGLGTFSARLITDDTTEATTTTDGSLQTDGGLSVAGDCVFGDDVKLLTDASVLSFGAGSDVTFTHDNSTGMNVASAGDFDIAVSAGNGTFTVADGQTLTLGKSGASALLLSPHGTAGSELASLINTAGTTDGADSTGTPVGAIV